MKMLPVFFIFLAASGCFAAEYLIQPGASFPRNEKQISAVPDRLTGLVDGGVSTLNKLVDGITSGVNRIVGRLTNGARSVVTALVKYYLWLAHGEINGFLSILGAVKSVISHVPVVRVIVGAVLDVIIAVLNKVNDYVDWVGEVVQGILFSWLDMIDGLAGVLTSLISAGISNVVGSIGYALKWAIGIVSGIVGQIEGTGLPRQIPFVVEPYQ